MSPDQVDWRAEDIEEAGLQVGGRPAQAFWLLLKPAFRRVLMEPHRRTGAGTVGWTWKDSRIPTSPSAADLRALRDRMRGALDEFAAELTWRDEGAADGRPSELHQMMAAMVRDLITSGDDRLAAHAVFSNSGWMIRSWGFSQPAKAIRDEEDGNTSESPSSGTRDVIPSPSRRRRRWPWIIMLAAMMAGLACVFLFWPHSSREARPVDNPVVAMERYAAPASIQANEVRPAKPSMDSPGGAGFGHDLSLSGVSPARGLRRGSTLSKAHAGLLPVYVPSRGVSLSPPGGAASGPSLTGETASGQSTFADAPDANDGPADDNAPERAPVVPAQMAGLDDPGHGGGAQPGIPGASADAAAEKADDLASSDQPHLSNQAPETLAAAHRAMPPGVASMPMAKRAAKLAPVQTALIAVSEAPTPPTPSGSSPVSESADGPSGAVVKKKNQSVEPNAGATQAMETRDEEKRSLDTALGDAKTSGSAKMGKVRASLRAAVAKSKNPYANAGGSESEADVYRTTPISGSENSPNAAAEKPESHSRSGAGTGTNSSPGIDAQSKLSVKIGDASNATGHGITLSCVIGQWRVHPVLDVVLRTWPSMQEAEQTLTKARSQTWTQTKGAQPIAFRDPVTRGGWSLRLSAAAIRQAAPSWRDARTGSALPYGIMEGEDARLSWEGLVPANGIDARLLATDGRELARLTVAPNEREIRITAEADVVEMAPWLTVALNVKGAKSDEMTWRSPLGKGSDARWETLRGIDKIGVVCHSDPMEKPKNTGAAVELFHAASGWAMTCEFTLIPSDDAPLR